MLWCTPTFQSLMALQDQWKVQNQPAFSLTPEIETFKPWCIFPHFKILWIYIWDRMKFHGKAYPRKTTETQKLTDSIEKYGNFTIIKFRRQEKENGLRTNTLPHQKALDIPWKIRMLHSHWQNNKWRQRVISQKINMKLSIRKVYFHW